jgi:hypothetical protein
MLRAQDIVVLLKLAMLPGGERPRQADLGTALGLSQAEVHKALKRAAEAGLYEPQQSAVLRRALLELLEHGVRYVYPARLGGPSRGLPTAWAAPPLSLKLRGGNDQERPVWAHPDGKVRGPAVKPLYETVPEAALHDVRLYEALALVDAIRLGGARERKLAVEELRRRLEL